MSAQIDTKHMLRGLLVLTLCAGGHAAAGCASDTNTPGYDDYGDASFVASGGFVGAGGAVGTGGYVVPGGSTGTGGSSGGTPSTGGSTASGGSDAGPACVVPDKPLIDPSAFSDCAVPSLEPECIDGKCIPSTLVPDSAKSLLADCDATNKCVPSLFVAYNNQFLVKTCTAIAGAEGRCLSLCIPQIHDQKALLKQDICETGELCAPCYDPRTGADTGACSQGCDTGPTQPAVVFATCCGGIGKCVPTDVVPEASRAQLGLDTCHTGELCAPDKLQDLTYVPKTCKSIGDLEGRCLAACIPAVAQRAGFLPQDTCDTGELCAPCYDPITGSDTQACRQNGDVPVNGPTTFDKCCNDLGHCVPSNVLSTDQKNLLGQDSCTNAGDLCAPDIFADPATPIETCRALFGSLDTEGRCVPTCVPAIQAQASRLSQATCQANYLCAPCYDPITGLSTGACEQNGDSPKEAKKAFPECCGAGTTASPYLGICVSTSLVPPDQVAQLGVDTCTGTDVLCAPKSLTDPTVTPPKCTTMSPLNIEGRCVPGCLPAVQDQKSNLRQETCSAGELCAPCYNPIDGVATGACSINGDAPVNQPKLFDSCGAGRGLCVPTALVPTSYQSILTADTCTGTGILCAPTEKIKDINYKFPVCQAQIVPFPAVPGACVPKFLTATNAAAGFLSQGTCATGELCAPCTNPLDGTNTGACN